ncbi:MAG: putative DNA-binding domain-containing protein [Deltaproteobacteria bacterium]|nr:putative DNA-binding domain-containing protein [Deltaproteobacteria bacterium]
MMMPKQVQCQDTSLQAVVETMHDLLRGNASPEQIAQRLGVKPKTIPCLMSYQDFVKDPIIDALASNYESVAALLPKTRWEALVQRFFHERPAHDFELNACVASFADFLEERITAGDEGLNPALVELARLEWQEFACYADEREVATTLETPQLNPTLAILELSYPVAAVLKAFRAREDGDPIPTLPTTTTPSPERIFVFREPRDHMAVFYPANDALLFALKMGVEGVTAEQAAEQARLSLSVVTSIVENAREIGLLI